MPQFSGMYSGPDRRDFDAYPTEITLIEEFLDQWGLNVALALQHRPDLEVNILDPCAGVDARWGVMLKQYLEDRFSHHCHLTAIDIQDFNSTRVTDWFPPPEVDEWITSDFSNFTSERKYDIIISNPPYGPLFDYTLPQGDNVRIPLAEIFIYQGWRLLANRGTMVYLLNLDIQSGQKRYDTLWNTHSPLHCIVCSRRPSFYGGSTSGNNYAVFLWRKNSMGHNMALPRRWQTHLMKHERGPSQ